MLDDSSLDETISFLAGLNMLDAAIKGLQEDLLAAIMNPILPPQPLGQSHEISVGEHGIGIKKPTPLTSISQTLDRIIAVLGYVRNLPVSISEKLSRAILPIISSKLVDSWLEPGIPIDLSGLNAFERVLEHLLELCRVIESYGWHGQEYLLSWVNQVPRLWLTRRRVEALDKVRQVLSQSTGSSRSVERAETQMVSSKDEVLLEDQVTDDWDEGWGNESKKDLVDEVVTGDMDDEEDVSAWDLDDNGDYVENVDEQPDRGHAREETQDEDDPGDAWGWGDEEDNKDSLKVPAVTPTRENGPDEKQVSTQREVTLTEQYTITDIPDRILALIQLQILDSESLSRPE